MRYFFWENRFWLEGKGLGGGVERGAQRGSKAAGETETGFHSPFLSKKKLGSGTFSLIVFRILKIVVIVLEGYFSKKLLDAINY